MSRTVKLHETLEELEAATKSDAFIDIMAPATGSAEPVRSRVLWEESVDWADAPGIRPSEVFPFRAVTTGNRLVIAGLRKTRSSDRDEVLIADGPVADLRQKILESVKSGSARSHDQGLSMPLLWTPVGVGLTLGTLQCSYSARSWASASLRPEGIDAMALRVRRIRHRGLGSARWSGRPTLLAAGARCRRPAFCRAWSWNRPHGGLRRDEGRVPGSPHGYSDNPPGGAEQVTAPRSGTEATDSSGSVGLAGRLAALGTLFSVALLAALVIAYAGRPAATALITVLPAWFWAAPGVLAAIFARRPGSRRRTAGLLVLWLVFILVFCEEPRAAVTWFRAWPDPEWQQAKDTRKGLRILTFNCGDGHGAAVREALGYSPDIAVLEESPTESEIRQEPASHPEMQLLYGFDVSIIARGEVTPAAPKQARWMFNAAYATVDGVKLAVVGLRLRVPRFTFAIWDPAEWRAAAESQRDHESEVRYVIGQIAELDQAVPLVIAGDFNAPAGDPLFRLLPDRLHDAFRESGIGLGNTMMNDMPVARIDQIWVDRRLQAHATVSRKTATSDHRLVIADVSLSW